MHVLVAFDKFKDSLSAPEACAIAREEILKAKPAWKVSLCPLADGGEGFSEILTSSVGGTFRSKQVQGPHANKAPVNARFGIVEWARLPAAAQELLDWHGNTPVGAKLAVVEMALASGLALLPLAERNVWLADTRGTGQLLKAALAETDHVLLGIGGSATHDLGMGALAALGWRFLDAHGNEVLHLSPHTWRSITRIVPADLGSAKVSVACDVTNPLLGPRGAAACYARQKGLPEADLERLEAESQRLSSLACEATERNLAETTEAAGSGAAGGISFGLDLALSIKRISGFDLVASWLDVEAKVRICDCVITGEGRFDATSLEGKGPGALVENALALDKSVAVFAGQVTTVAPSPRVRLRAIARENLSLAENLARGGEHLRAAVREWVAAQ
ncbi:glycerate kinase [Nibricoccus sp. IMCC34717]|uniref:glycerate kinase n=1 Tax=Nibricoccus sp. IMCC34717 TaxID=3034021 RepID=UPI0038502ADD